jgi:hypothetical protein
MKMRVSFVYELLKAVHEMALKTASHSSSLILRNSFCSVEQMSAKTVVSLGFIQHNYFSTSFFL